MGRVEASLARLSRQTVSSNKGRELNKTQRLQQARGKGQEKPPRRAVMVSRTLATFFLRPSEVPSGRVSLVDIFHVLQCASREASGNRSKKYLFA